jgi:hypothetical protein
MGNSFALRHFKRRVYHGRHEDHGRNAEGAKPARPGCLIMLIRFSCELERAAVGRS